ncbi:hydrogenase maturation nickel metallochaperone HypA [Anaeromicropila herbilytica]|uniref:hydrogenase maturation nickel metallochaperone HypA n=1 Tax=Anaeromicropila herbilytica TaxID=2785025 RepID=UPI002FE6CD82
MNNLHELGVVIEVVKTVEKVAVEQQLTKIDTVILQIGELSSMIPRYVEQCYPAAVDGTILEGTNLKIEVLPGNALCKECNKVFNLIQNNSKCPHCGSNDFEIISGREFFIKEIVAY